MAGTTVTITWRERKVSAWVPEPLGSLDLDLSVDTARRSERAVAAVRLADEHLPAHWEPLARLLLRAEGVASSDIEGLRAPLGLVAAAELDADAVAGTAAWVADNLAVVHSAINEATAGPLTVPSLHRWHERLMRHGTLPVEMVGGFRSAQGWIGGTSPTDAVFVPPPPELVAALMDDLVEFVNRDDLDSVTQAAVAHAQFETIHPYGDGNGRIGRVLVSWVLARRERVSVPPPVSVLIGRDPGGYLSGLHAFRMDEMDTWVGWFADVVRGAGNAAISLVDRVEVLMAGWRERLDDLRADATARAVIELLPEHPVLSTGLVADRLGVSEPAGRNALETLSDRGMIEPFEIAPTAPGRPRHWWLVKPLIDAVVSWAD